MTKHRTRILSLAMLLALACNERTIDSHEIPTDPLCMYAGGATGMRAAGTSSYILRSEGSGHPYVCACTTEEQYEDEAEFLRVREELNDRLLEECVRVANARGF